MNEHQNRQDPEERIFMNVLITRRLRKLPTDPKYMVVQGLQSGHIFLKIRQGHSFTEMQGIPEPRQALAIKAIVPSLVLQGKGYHFTSVKEITIGARRPCNSYNLKNQSKANNKM